jgi:hypothetical protein
MIESMYVDNIGVGPRVRITPASGLSQYFRLSVDGVLQGSPVYAQTGQETELCGVWQFASVTGHAISVCPLGDWASSDFDLSAQVDRFSSGRARRLSLTIEPTVLAFSSGTQLTNWTGVTGLRRFLNCSPVTSHPTWASLRYVLTNTGGTYNVALKLGSTTLASGSRTGDGSVNVAAIVSGVTGAVTITYTGEESGNVYFAWPSAYAIHWKTGSGFTGADFPRTANDTIYDDGASNAHYYFSDVLSPADYYVVVHQIDDAGNESTGLAGGGTVVTTYGPPAHVTSLAYLTGDDSATSITFVSGSGATGYRIYDSHASGVMDMSSPTFTTGTAGTTVLSGITSGYSGYRYVIVRATVGGVDDGNSDRLRIEYSGGLVVLPRPPAPGMATNPQVSGRTMRVTCSMSLAEYDALPTYVELFAWEMQSGSFNSGSPLSTGTIATGTMRVGTEIVITVSGTVASDGEYFYLVRSLSSGGIYSPNSNSAGPVRLTTVQPPEPDAFTAKGI